MNKYGPTAAQIDCLPSPLGKAETSALEARVAVVERQVAALLAQDAAQVVRLGPINRQPRKR